jgi:hypothetical protein
MMNSILAHFQPTSARDPVKHVAFLHTWTLEPRS